MCCALAVHNQCHARICPIHTKVTMVAMSSPQPIAGLPEYSVHLYADQHASLQQLVLLEEGLRAVHQIPGRLVEDVANPTNRLLYAVHVPSGQAAGYCVCAVTSLVAHVLKLVVAPGHRRRGVGTALMQAVLAYTPSWGCCCCRLHVREHNLEARGLYHKLGFLEDAVLEDYYGPGKHGLRLLKDAAA